MFGAEVGCDGWKAFRANKAWVSATQLSNRWCKPLPIASACSTNIMLASSCTSPRKAHEQSMKALLPNGPWGWVNYQVAFFKNCSIMLLPATQQRSNRPFSPKLLLQCCELGLPWSWTETPGRSAKQQPRMLYLPWHLLRPAGHQCRAPGMWQPDQSTAGHPHLQQSHCHPSNLQRQVSV